jgi:microcystin-dependent protein
MVDLSKPNTFVPELLYSFAPVTYDLVPRGTIVAFSNNYTIPNGWSECNGNNGTPDLRGRFILGRGSGAGLSVRTYGQTGGEETHLLTTDEMPSHSHVIDACGNHIHNVDACGNHIHNIDACGNHIHNIDVCGNHVHTINNAGDHTHTSNSDANNGLISRDGTETATSADDSPNEPNVWNPPVVLSINTAGDHTHTMQTEGSHIHTMQNTGSHIHTMENTGSHIHTMQTSGSHIHIAQNTGGDTAHNNMPPFYVLIYIMKL